MAIKESLAFELVVIENFLDHVKGDIVTEAKKIESYLDSEWQNHFVKKAVAPLVPLAS